ncbi:hypothetical protein NQ357_25285, partial [Escherichia coli]|nr:hypothetical protein [Escherichia coli]
WETENVLGHSGVADHEGNIWFSGETFFLYKYTPGVPVLEKFPLAVPTFIATWSMILEKGGKLLLGTTEGLWIKDVHSK